MTRQWDLHYEAEYLEKRLDNSLWTRLALYYNPMREIFDSNGHNKSHSVCALDNKSNPLSRVFKRGKKLTLLKVEYTRERRIKRFSDH
ncbi:Hypothetical protein NTJ_04454 [Nesidiocoris tenuis]|uniref:Uncharacterized protein n=1 Tax=Nesidiocoris tenuis TaxID=355587 RepID=A0ABN7AHB5_9HEMI|nr:Hypothetical protein NTJ_04454 [Nesidiocoris tenuis]